MDYAKLYASFIADRRAKEKVIAGSGVYTEKHHIIPKSMGGDDSKENLIRLTAGDHYFAHLILARCYGGKMWLAVAAMCNMPGHSKRRDFVAKRRWVEAAREGSLKSKSENAKRLHKDPSFVAKLHSSETKAKRAKTMASLYQNADFRRRKSEGQKVAFSKPQYRELLSAIQKEVQNRPEVKAKRAEMMRNCNPMHNEKTREIVGQQVKEYCAKLEVKAAMSERLMCKDHPIHSESAKNKRMEKIKLIRSQSPDLWIKVPVIVNGKRVGLKEAGRILGTSDSNLRKFATQKGLTAQQVCDWYASTTPKERLAQRKPRGGYVIFQDQQWTKKELCEKYGISFFKVLDASKKSGNPWIEEFNALLSISA